MKKFALVSALVVAACGADSETDRGDGGHDDSDDVIELGQVELPGRIAVSGECVVVVGFGGAACVPLAGGDARLLAPLTNRSFVSPVADGDTGVIVATLSLNFGPDGDRTMHIDRIGLDGSVMTLGMAFAGYGAGEGLAIAGDRIVFSTGGSADLLSIPRAGGPTKQLASDSGNFGDVAVIGTTAYYLNGGTVYAHDLTSTSSSHGTAYGSTGFFDEATLATDGTSMIAVGSSFDEAQQTVVQLVPATTAIPPLDGSPGYVAMTGNRAYVIAGGNLHEVDLATSTSTLVFDGVGEDEDVADVAIAGDLVVWIQFDGKVRAQELRL